MILIKNYLYVTGDPIHNMQKGKDSSQDTFRKKTIKNMKMLMSIMLLNSNMIDINNYTVIKYLLDILFFH